MCGGADDDGARAESAIAWHRHGVSEWLAAARDGRWRAYVA